MRRKKRKEFVMEMSGTQIAACKVCVGVIRREPTSLSHTHTHIHTITPRHQTLKETQIKLINLHFAPVASAVINVLNQCVQRHETRESALI